MISIRMAVTAGLWLLPVAASAVPRTRPRLVDAALHVATAATAGVLAYELLARRGDDMTASLMVALDLHDRDRAAALEGERRPVLRSV